METRDTGDGAADAAGAAGSAFFHPVGEREVIAGAATIGAEIIENLSDVEAGELRGHPPLAA